MNKTGLTIEDVKDFDEWAVDMIGLPSIILMENAGKSVADEVYRQYFEKDKGFTGVAIFCGTGHNGGDGLVAARHLFVKGVTASVYIIGGVSKFSLDTELNFRILRKLGVTAHPLLSDRDLTKTKINEHYIVIDAIFGVGVDRPIIGFFRKAIDKINDLKNPVIAVDIPSGFNADDGSHWGISVKATRTITMIGEKKGFETAGASDYLGRITVVELGIDNVVGVEVETEEDDDVVEEDL